MSPSADEKKKPVGFRFDPKLENFLQLVSHRSGINKTVLVEQSLGYYFGDTSDPMLQRRRDFVLSVIHDLVEEGSMPAHLAPETGKSPTLPRSQIRGIESDTAGGKAAATVKGDDIEQLAKSLPPGKASSAAARNERKARGEASKHAQRMIAARLKRRSAPR